MENELLPETVSARLSEDEYLKLRAYMAMQPMRVSESAAIRYLVSKGLTALGIVRVENGTVVTTASQKNP